MKILLRKLFRTIWKTKGQFFAMVAVVALGITMYIAMTTALYNLTRSQETFYRGNNFADYFFHVVRAPQEITRQIEAINGVVKATGRIQKDVPILKDNGERAIARLTSYPLPMDKEVNRLQVQEGRLFTANPTSGEIEVLLDPQYTQANEVSKGQHVVIVAEGKKVFLSVTGTATSPEFIYAMKDAASIIPEPKVFGIVMIPLNQAQQVLNMSGQINQVVVKLAPGADEEEIASRIKTLLEPYGNLADYPRKQQLSHAMLQAELDGLAASSRFLPVMFLGVAAAIQIVLLRRMIKTQRLQIGIMKALGFSNWGVMLHYTSYALSITMLGAVLGTFFGLMMASLLSHTYTLYFNLPEAIGGVNLEAVFFSFLLSALVGSLSGLSASRQVLKIRPAEAMRSEPPRSGGKTALEKWGWLWHRLGATWKMTLRTLSRNKVRFAVVLAGMVAAIGMLLIAFFGNDSIDYMLERHFYQEIHYDCLLRFAGPVNENELLNITRLEGVNRAEPLMELPVKLHFQGRSDDDLLLGLQPRTTLKAIYDANDRLVAVPEEGLVINQLRAKKLGLEVGDIVEVETLLGLGPTHTAELKVVGINKQLVGSESYCSLQQANRLLGEGQVITAAMLKVDPGLQDSLHNALNEMSGITSVLNRQKELDNFQAMMGSMIYFTGIMSIFALVLGFAIVYNAAVLSFSERSREMATLRVLGFTAAEISGLLFKETMLQSALGILVGLPVGRLMIESYVNSVSTDLYSMPVVIYPSTYLYAGLGGIIFIMVGHFFAVRGVKTLDLVEVLKSRE